MLYSLHIPKLDAGAAFALPLVGPQLKPRQQSVAAVGLFDIDRMSALFADLFSV